jgi:homopolymeric O-antigen transport system permease protein
MSTPVEFAEQPVAAAPTPAAPMVPVRAVSAHTVIRPPGRGLQLVNLSDLWRSRDLIVQLIRRDLKVRYKHTVIGIGWAVLQPLLMMLVFATYFGLVSGFEEGKVPYPVYVFSGLGSWILFSSATTAASFSVIQSEHLVQKIYFPRLALTIASLGVYVVDFVINLVLLVVLMLFFGLTPGWGLLVAPLVVLLFILAALSLGILLAALNVTYRDFRLVIPFMMQLWFFATPHIFMQPPEGAPVAAVKAGSIDEDTLKRKGLSPEEANQEKLRARLDKFLYINPVSSLIVTFRAAVLGTPVPWKALGTSMAFFLVILVAGSVYFRRVEERFADII